MSPSTLCRSRRPRAGGNFNHLAVPGVRLAFKLLARVVALLLWHLLRACRKLPQALRLQAPHFRHLDLALVGVALLRLCDSGRLALRLLLLGLAHRARPCRTGCRRSGCCSCSTTTTASRSPRRSVHTRRSRWSRSPCAGARQDDNLRRDRDWGCRRRVPPRALLLVLCVFSLGDGWQDPPSAPLGPVCALRPSRHGLSRVVPCGEDVGEGVWKPRS